MGMLVIFNMIVCVKNGLNFEIIEKFYDFFVLEEVVDFLVIVGWFGIDGIRVFILEICNLLENVKLMVVDYVGLLWNMDDVICDFCD